MMKYFGILLFAPFFLHSAEENPPSPPSYSQQMKSSMSIEPKARALDYAQAFELLRKEKMTSKVFFKMKNGTIISNIIDLTLMNNGTLIFFRFNSPQGVQHQAINIEELEFLSHY